MATFKHISSKNADYGAAEQYLTFEHDEFTMKPTLDENGRLMLREDYRIATLNCGDEDFAVACMRSNLRYGKNQKREDVKSHHYIISFDPRDAVDNGLTVDRAQALGEEFCRKQFPGHQAIVCTHPDGHNHSGNIHVHIVINSLRMMNKFCALMLSVALCAGMAAPAFAYGGEPVEEVEQPVLTSTTDEEDVVTVTDEETGALTPEGNLTMVDDYHTSYSDGSGQQFITLVSKSGNTFYLVIDRNDKGENTVHFMNLVDEADLLSLMEDEDADAYTAEKEAAAQAEQERKQAEEDAKKAAEEAVASGSEQTGGNKVTKYAATFLGVLALVGLVAGGGIYTFMKQKQKKQAEKEALAPDANYTEDKGDFEIPVEDEPEETGEEDNAEE